jgi:hypothetical protein
MARDVGPAGRLHTELICTNCVSLETLRQLGIRTAFTFDRHFAGQGFEWLPVA